MFRCGFCQEVTKPGQKATRITTEIREFTHPARKDAHRFVQEGFKVVKDDPGGIGTQISSEALACPSCASMSPEFDG